MANILDLPATRDFISLSDDAYDNLTEQDFIYLKVCIVK